VSYGPRVTSLTPLLTVRNAASAVDFYPRTFGAEELSRLTAPNGHWLISKPL
jgi:uncharacterized glyoxalase superfamily protein PhnB